MLTDAHELVAFGFASTREWSVAQGASVLRIITSDLSQPAGIDSAATAIAQAERQRDPCGLLRRHV
jgi:hypothetical protein